MQSLGVIEHHVVNDFRDRLHFGVEQALVHQLRFQGVEVGLHDCVVQWIAFAAHAANHPGLLQQFPIVVRGVFDALVRVEEATRRRRLIQQGHAQRTLGELAIATAAEGPPYHPATEQIDDRGVVQPASAGFHVGEVTGPLLPAAGRRVTAFELIAGGAVKRVLTRSPGIETGGGRFDLQRPHQPIHPSTTATQSLLTQCLMYPWRTIGPPIPLVQLNDSAFEDLIVLSMTAHWPGKPSVKATTRHTEK